ncbi:MAG TPA: carboxypeptidase-like regulatory domain-containing protein [Acidobacteriaceae bacterium]
MCWIGSLLLGCVLPLARMRGETVLSPAGLPDSPGHLLAAAQTVAAQTGTAVISGLITDVNGGVVPGATIAIVGAGGATLRQTTAGSEGEFRLEALAAGVYKLRIQAQGLQTFESPEIKLADGQDFKLPATALPIANAGQTVDVVMTTEQIAQEEIKEQTQQRVLGILPNFYTSYVWDAAPMNARQKYKLAFRTIIDPWVFARTAITAGIQQANGTFPEYGDGGSGYAKRYFAAYGDAVTGRVIGSAILPALFHQDPRYFYRGTGGVPRRTLHALVSAVAARRDGGRVELNYSHTIGNCTAGYISRTWHPGSGNGISLALDDMLIAIGDAAGRNLVQEFLYKRISRGTPPFAKGKPPEEKESAIHP